MCRLHRFSPIAIAVVVAACNQGGSDTPSQPAAQATAAPSFSVSLDSVPAADVTAYAQGLEFDTLPMARDVRHLVRTIRSSLTVVNFVKFEPELHAWATDTTALAAGRVVARIRSTMNDIDPLGGPGTTYVWVDKRYGNWRLGYVRPNGTIFWQAAQIATVASHTMGTASAQTMSQSRLKQGEDGRWYICTSCSSLGWCQTDSTGGR